MENFDNWEMLKTAVEAKETEEILTRSIMSDFENITNQKTPVKIKQENYDNDDDSFANYFDVDLLSANNENNHNHNQDNNNQNKQYCVNDMVIKKESIEISVDETDLDDGGNSMDDNAIFSFANENVNINKNNIVVAEAEEESKTDEISQNLTLTGRPVRAAAIAKFGLTQKQALDEAPLDYESAIIYICPACGFECFSHEEWKRHIHVQHKFNTPEGLNFKKIDKLYNECQQCLKHIAMHCIENLLKHKFTHLPFRCTKCRICMRQYKYRQDLIVHLRMTHLTDLMKIKKTGEWSAFEQQQRERIESNSSSNIFAIKNVQANAVDIYGQADHHNENDDDDDDDDDHDDNAVCVQNERLELDDYEKLIDYETHENSYQNKITDTQRKSLLETALSGQQHSDNKTVEEGFSERDIKLCEPYIMHICPQCGDTYEKQNEWQEHIEIEHDFGNATGLGFELQDNNVAMCKECLKEFPNVLSQLQVHRFSHARHRQWMRCSLCYRAFTLLKDLRRHLLLQHNLANSPPDDYEDMENYQLEVYRDNFEQHIEYLCPQCGRKYKDRKLWRRHLIYSHRLADLKVLHFRVINETQVICLDCEKVITNAYGIQNAQQHRFTHMPFKAYIRCRICNKAYTERKGTVKHLRKAHHISITNNNSKATTKSTSNTDTDNNSKATTISTSNTDTDNNSKATIKSTSNTDTGTIKFRFEDNNSYYNKRTAIEPKREIVRKNNYLYEIQFLDDIKLGNYCSSANNNDHNENVSDYDDDYIDDNAAVPELIFDHSKNQNAKQYKCNYCVARFTHHTLLTLHLNESHGKQEERTHRIHSYDDPPAKKIKTQQNMTNEKLKKTKLEDYYYFLCPACGEQFPEQGVWRQHINEVHHFNKRRGLNFKPISPYTYQCLQCDDIVDSKLQTMQEHKFGHLPYVLCVKCRLCIASFSWKSSMIEHLCTVHNISDTEPKTILPKKNHLQEANEVKTLNISKLKAVTTSTRQSPLLPAAITNSSGTEYAHNAVDHATITYFCPLCNDNFSTHYMWRRHIVDLHNFNSCEGLNFRKINEHHFLCLQCYKRVTVTHTKGAICQLQSHKFRHLPHRSFKCTACNEMFVRKQMFFKHLDKFTNQCAVINQKIKQPHKLKAPNNKRTISKSYDNSMESVNNNIFTNDTDELELQKPNENEENRLQHQHTEEEEFKDGENQEPFIFVCPSCGIEFHKLYLWREHINNEHNLNLREVLNFKRLSATQHQCLQCFECVNGKKLRDLQAHKFKHLTHTHYLRCLICKASYTHLRNMQDHIRNRHPEVYIDKYNNTEDNRSSKSNEDTEESCLPNNFDMDTSSNDLPGTHSFENDN